MPYQIYIATADEEIEACYGIRRAVFVEEQAVPLEIEMDEYDEVAVHFLMRDDAGDPVGTARLVAKADAAKIGRVAIVERLRGRGYGRAIMEHVLDEARRRDFREAILSSQLYALPFYENLGFVAEGPTFDDAGIPHRMMRLSLVEPIGIGADP